MFAQSLALKLDSIPNQTDPIWNEAFVRPFEPPSVTVPGEYKMYPWLKSHRARLEPLLNGTTEPEALGRPMRICVITDAWEPQVNGVVRTLQKLKAQMEEFGHEVLYITHENFKTVPLPTYPEIRLALRPAKRISKMINDFEPDSIHICTEGTLGLAARQWCIRRNHPYTASYHTRLPDYLNARTKFPIKWGYNIQRRFHQPASAIMATTPTLCGELEERGFKQTRLWSRGVDLDRFQIYETDILDHLPRPIWTYVGRVAVEKNLEAFLDLNLEGTKVIVGDGPQMEELKAKYPDVHFAGTRHGEELAKHYAASDVFVFPSLTDTFGLVNLEALACGTPVAAYPVVGPKDIIGDARVGCLDEDLEKACRGALGIATPEECRAHALTFSWAAGTKQFIDNLALPAHKPGYWEESRKFPD